MISPPPSTDLPFGRRTSGVHPDAVLHPLAVVDEGATVGARTRVWAFAHVLPGAVVGADVNLCDHTYVETGVLLGDRVTVKCGVHLWEGVQAEDDVFIGPSAVFTNDLAPRSRRAPATYARTLLGRGCSVGANATVLAGRRVGRYALVAAAAVVTRDVPDHALVVGSPARVAGWVDLAGARLAFDADGHATGTDGERYRLDPGSDGSGHLARLASTPQPGS